MHALNCHRLLAVATATIGLGVSASSAGVQTELLMDNTSGGTHTYAANYQSSFWSVSGYSRRVAFQFDIDSGYTASLTRVGGFFGGDLRFDLLTGTDIYDAMANPQLGTDYADAGAAPAEGDSIEYFNFSNVNQTLTAGRYFLVISSGTANFNGVMYGGSVGSGPTAQVAGISNVSGLFSQYEGNWGSLNPHAIVLEGTANSTAPAVPGPSVAFVSAMGLAGIARRRRR